MRGRHPAHPPLSGCVTIWQHHVSIGDTSVKSRVLT